jgi:hypothetical protein
MVSLAVKHLTKKKIVNSFQQSGIALLASTGIHSCNILNPHTVSKVIRKKSLFCCPGSTKLCSICGCNENDNNNNNNFFLMAELHVYCISIISFSQMTFSLLINIFNFILFLGYKRVFFFAKIHECETRKIKNVPKCAQFYYKPLSD